MVTTAPSPASRWAHASPIPEPPPVTSAAMPSRLAMRPPTCPTVILGSICTAVHIRGGSAMTEAAVADWRERLGPLGVWAPTPRGVGPPADGLPLPKVVELVQRIESLVYSAVWPPDTMGRDPFAHIA